MQHFVVMGVTGCGKSTIAQALAERLDGTMLEADALHGLDNIEKMGRGEALTDDDRWPWLARVGDAMIESHAPAFVSCSALRRIYREYLLEHGGMPIGFVHLHAPADVISARMSKRTGHFMPTSLLESQLQLLEPLQDDEIGVVIDVDQPIEKIVDDAMVFIQSKMG